MRHTSQQAGSGLVGHQDQVPDCGVGMPHPPLARVQPLLEDCLRLARQVPLPRLRLTEELHKLLSTSRFGILEVVHKRLGALERVIQHADQRVRGLLRAGGLLCRRGSARLAAHRCLLRCRHRCPWRHGRDVSLAPAAPAVRKLTAPV